MSAVTDRPSTTEGPSLPPTITPDSVARSLLGALFTAPSERELVSAGSELVTSTPTHAPAEPGRAAPPDGISRPAAEVQWHHLADAAASRATRRALAVPGVCRARFVIDGSAEAPRLTARVSIRPDAPFSRAVDAVVENVVPEMERALGHRFAENALEFDVSSPWSRAQSAPTLTIT